MFYASSLSQNSSLEHLVSYLDSRYGIRLCKQSLNERFNEKTVAFVKSVLSRLIHEQFPQHLFTASFLSAFNYEFDLKTGNFLDLTLTEAVRNDQQDANETADNVCQGELTSRNSTFL